MRMLLSILAAIIIAVPAMAEIQRVTITVTDEVNEPLIGATVRVKDSNVATVTNNNGVAELKNVSDNATITISYTGYIPQEATATNSINIKLIEDSKQLNTVTVTACDASKSIPDQGIKKQKVVADQCVPSECFEPCYKLNEDKCELQSIENGKWEFDTEKQQCNLTCNSGYDADGESCVRANDDTPTPQAEEDEEDDDDAKDDDDNSSVNGKECAKKDRPANSTKSHQYYDASTKQTLCLVDECKKGYKVSNDKLSCILESALSDADAKKRLDELKQNAADMKAKEQSTANKMLGAAGIATVGIGGMMTASALAEKSADKDAEEDMKAYLATFRCDYGQGRNIMGGETNVQLPGTGDLGKYKTEYTQLATNLKSDKAALGMTPGIESELVFNSADVGLYDDVSIGTQRGAFTSLARALTDENSADAAAWKSQTDSTATKLKAGAAIAGIGAVGTLAGNLIVNNGKSNQSGNILKKFQDKKQPVVDLTLERIPCTKINGTVNDGNYIPNCTCPGTNSYFAENERECIQCGTNEHVENKTCVCNIGMHRDQNSGTCVNGAVPAPKTDTTDNTTTTPPTTTPTEQTAIETVVAAVTGNSATGNNDAAEISVNITTDHAFATSAYAIDNDKCTEIINKIKASEAYKANPNLSGDLCIRATGHTDTQWFAKTYNVKTNEEKNKTLSEQRAQAAAACISRNIKQLYTSATATTPTVRGLGWSECAVTTPNTKTDACRKVTIEIYKNTCPK